MGLLKAIFFSFSPIIAVPPEILLGIESFPKKNAKEEFAKLVTCMSVGWTVLAEHVYR